MGVLCWPPEALNGAALEDLADAYEGYAMLSMPAPEGVTGKFLDEMMRKFPDKDKGPSK